MATTTILSSRLLILVFAKLAWGLSPLKSQTQDSSEYYIKKSLDYYQSRDFLSALACVNLSIHFNEFSDSAYFRRSLIREKMQQPAGAIEDLSSAIYLNPKPIYYNNRGMLFSFRENFDAALFDFNQAIALDPQYGLSYFNKATCLYYKGDFTNACEVMKKANELKVEGAVEFLQEFCK